MKMTIKLLVVLVNLAAFNAFAGPEEHIAAQSCYALTAQAANVPEEICLEEITITNPDMTSAKIEIYSYVHSKLYANLKLDSVSRKNEDGHSFKASSVIASKKNAACGASAATEVVIAGRVNNYGEGNASEVQVSVKQTSVNSASCQKQTSVYFYQLK